MFNIEYYGSTGAFLGCDENLDDVFAVSEALSNFGRSCQHGDTIKIIDLDEVNGSNNPWGGPGRAPLTFSTNRV